MYASDIFSRKKREMNLEQWINFITWRKFGESTREILDLFKMAYDERNSKKLSFSVLMSVKKRPRKYA